MRQNVGLDAGDGGDGGDGGYGDGPQNNTSRRFQNGREVKSMGFYFKLNYKINLSQCQGDRISSHL